VEAYAQVSSAVRFLKLDEFTNEDSNDEAGTNRPTRALTIGTWWHDTRCGTKRHCPQPTSRVDCYLDVNVMTSLLTA
jgi:hypothetical protein